MTTVNINNTTIDYEIVGQGEPVLLIPGLGLDKTYYRLGVPYLSKFVKTIAVDPRGVGLSDKKLQIFTVEQWADDFAALIDTLGLGSVHVVGSSLGGCMAMALAEKYPNKVKSLIPIGSFSELDHGIETNFRLRISIINQLGMGEDIATHMGLWTLSRSFFETPQGQEVFRLNKENINKNSPEIYKALITSILDFGKKLPNQDKDSLFTSKLKNIKCNTLVLTGDDDHFIPASHSQRIAQNIPNAKYMEIHGGGHIPFIQKPKETAHAVLNFLMNLE
jgi:pimeloyl-ACP methyl ester carboxylesterase